MNYATWRLNFEDSNYGTGPESKIVELGFTVEAAWSDGQVEDGGTILGYVDGEPDAVLLTNWNFQYITIEEALAFAVSIDSTAYLNEDGKIASKVIINPRMQ